MPTMGEYGDTYAGAVARMLRSARTAPIPKDRKTFDDLAKELGLAKTTVLNYFNGIREIPVPAFVEICRALGLNPGEVLDAAQREVNHEQL